MIFPDDDEDLDTSKIEFISSLSKEDSFEKFKNKETKSGLVIPLKDSKGSVNDTATKITTISFEEENNGVKIEEKKKKVWGLQVPERHKKASNTPSSSDMPLLMKNRVIGLENCKSESEKLSKDLNSRPEEPSKESYTKISVEDFGAAMLRGMGWTGPDSDTSKIIRYVPRPERLGLGATEVTDASELKQRKPVEQSLGIEMSKEEEKKLMTHKKRMPVEIPRTNVMGIDEIAPKRLKIAVEIGSRVIISEGEHSGLKGYVKCESKDSKFWLIELEINGRDAMIMKSHVKLHDSTVSKYQTIHNFPKTNDNALLWACSGLKVKIKSKSFENGKFYNRKGIILDVQPDKTCTIKLLDTPTPIILQCVPQRTLETCLPRDIDPTRPTVKFLQKYQGEDHFQALFRVLQFDDERGRAIIQAEDDFQFIFEAHYDDICEFTSL